MIGGKIDVEPPIEIDEITSLAIYARTHGLTVYDASYLQLAAQRGAILATLDNAMRAAAGRQNIPLLPA